MAACRDEERLVTVAAIAANGAASSDGRTERARRRERCGGSESNVVSRGNFALLGPGMGS